METVEVEAKQQQHSADNDAEAGPTKPKPKRGRHLTGGGEARDRRVPLPPACNPAFLRLKQELELGTDAATLHWLLHRVRPDLLPDGPPKPKPKPQPRGRKATTACAASTDGDRRDPAGSGGDLDPRRPVRATVVQASTVFFDTPATLDKAEKLIAGAAAYGSQIVVFPEAFVGGYPRCVLFDVGGPPPATETGSDMAKYYASAIDVPGPEVERLAKIASEYGVHLVMGVVERAGFNLFSTVLFFDPQGRCLGKHRKLMPTEAERVVWYSGTNSPMPLHDTSIGTIGGLICWDNKLPLLRASLYSKGVEIYCAPTADAGEVWKASMTHVAIEGCCFVLSANQFSRRRDYPLPRGDSKGDVSLDAIVSAGGSFIASPSGAILAGPNYEGECLIAVDLDFEEIAQAKMKFCGAGNSIGPHHVGWTENGANPILFPADTRKEVKNVLPR